MSMAAHIALPCNTLTTIGMEVVWTPFISLLLSSVMKVGVIQAIIKKLENIEVSITKLIWKTKMYESYRTFVFLIFVWRNYVWSGFFVNFEFAPTGNSETLWVTKSGWLHYKAIAAFKGFALSKEKAYSHTIIPHLQGTGLWGESPHLNIKCLTYKAPCT